MSDKGRPPASANIAMESAYMSWPSHLTGSIQTKDLWSLATDAIQIDPEDLVAAIEQQVRRGDLDYRSRLLIHDSLEALQTYWGAERLQSWLRRCALHLQIKAIWRASYEEVGFPSLRRRLMSATRPEQIKQFLRELSLSVRRPITLTIGGSIALILLGLLVRSTEDINVVNAVPVELLAEAHLLDTLAQRYGLMLTHFQSHYLPQGWMQRVHSHESFGQLQVFLVDPYDIFLGKLFSAHLKDCDDLRVLARQLDQDIIRRRFQDTAQDLLSTPGARENAEQNWYVLYGEPLPSLESPT
jgi:hypothetical protein